VEPLKKKICKTGYDQFHIYNKGTTKFASQISGLLESKMLVSLYVCMHKEVILLSEHQESYYMSYDSVVDVDKMAATTSRIRFQIPVSKTSNYVDYFLFHRSNIVIAVVCKLQPFLEVTAQRENPFGKIAITVYCKKFNSVSME
jgi:hypothetical protein